MSTATTGQEPTGPSAQGLKPVMLWGKHLSSVMDNALFRDTVTGADSQAFWKHFEYQLRAAWWESIVDQGLESIPSQAVEERAMLAAASCCATAFAA